MTQGAMSDCVLDFRKDARCSAQELWRLDRSVFLVGFMGAGKTSVARKLAHRAGLASIDMDTYIERCCGMKIRDIFKEAGEQGFRAIETDTLRELASGQPLLVSCGGGVVLAQRNRQILKEGGFVAYLKVTAAEAASRISDISTRPLFGDLEQAQRVIEGRLPLYEEVADVTLDTAGRGSAAVARELFYALKDAGVLVRRPSEDSC